MKKRTIDETKIDCINLQQNMESRVQQEVRFKKRMKRSNGYDSTIEKLLTKQKKNWMQIEQTKEVEKVKEIK